MYEFIENVKKMVATHVSSTASYSRKSMGQHTLGTDWEARTGLTFASLSGFKRVGSNEANRSEKECNSSETHDEVKAR